MKSFISLDEEKRFLHLWINKNTNINEYNYIFLFPEETTTANAIPGQYNILFYIIKGLKHDI